MFCSQCGTKNPENSAYCYNCGKRIATSLDSSQLGTNPSPEVKQPTDPFARAKCRALARAIVADKLGLEAVCVRSRSDGSPYLVLTVPKSIPAEKRAQDWLTLYYAGVEAEKRCYGSFTGDGNGELEDLAHEFHLEQKSESKTLTT
jgi:zinc-ribbon domain